MTTHKTLDQAVDDFLKLLPEVVDEQSEKSQERAKAKLSAFFKVMIERGEDLDARHVQSAAALVYSGFNPISDLISAIIHVDDFPRKEERGALDKVYLTEMIAHFRTDYPLAVKYSKALAEAQQTQAESMVIVAQSAQSIAESFKDIAKSLQMIARHH